MDLPQVRSSKNNSLVSSSEDERFPHTKAMQKLIKELNRRWAVVLGVVKLHLNKLFIKELNRRWAVMLGVVETTFLNKYLFAGLR